MFEIFLTILYQFMVAKILSRISHFLKLILLMKVDVLPFLNVSSTWGLPIFCKFEEWKRFAQFLVGKPTLPNCTRFKPDR